jgi:hypothetical protein
MDQDRSRPTQPLLGRGAALYVAVSMVVAIAYLQWQGRVWWCEQGDPNPISLRIDVHNSQHLLDAYSFSHVLHGVLFFGILWWFRGRWSLSVRAAIASTIEIGWEMAENSPFIIDRYRAATISLGYTGDSIANSICDVASFLLGFYLARALGLWKSVVLFVVTELVMLWLIRDNLALNVLMLLWPIDAVRRWQAGG